MKEIIIKTKSPIVINSNEKITRENIIKENDDNLEIKLNNNIHNIQRNSFLKNKELPATLEERYYKIKGDFLKGYYAVYDKTTTSTSNLFLFKKEENIYKTNEEKKFFLEGEVEFSNLSGAFSTFVYADTIINNPITQLPYNGKKFYIPGSSIKGSIKNIIDLEIGREQFSLRDVEVEEENISIDNIEIISKNIGEKNKTKLVKNKTNTSMYIKKDTILETQIKESLYEDLKLKRYFINKKTLKKLDYNIEKTKEQKNKYIEEKKEELKQNEISKKLDTKFKDIFNEIKDNFSVLNDEEQFDSKIKNINKSIDEIQKNNNKKKKNDEKYYQVKNLTNYLNNIAEEITQIDKILNNKIKLRNELEPTNKIYLFIGRFKGRTLSLIKKDDKEINNYGLYSINDEICGLLELGEKDE